MYPASCAAAEIADIDHVRRLISEIKKFVTKSCQKVVHNAMQVVGGIGYTNVLPLSASTATSASPRSGPAPTK